MVSAFWPGSGTVVGYNAADLAISLFFIGPLAEKWFGGEFPPGPPPAAMDAGVLEGDPPLPAPVFVDAGVDDQTLRGTCLCMCDEVPSLSNQCS